MDKDQVLARIRELRVILSENSRRYYVDNAPVLSDQQYDMLMHELEDLENGNPEFISEDSPTRKVGSDIEPSLGSNAEGAYGTGFISRLHRYPMLSLANTYSIAEIEEFAERSDKTLEGHKFTYSCELKFDGTAICLTYRHGELAMALTRGDGVKGDDVTRNALRISGIPRHLKGDFPEEFEIRGEVLMPYASFEKLNAERLRAGEEPFANPRNAASGSLKLLDPEEVGHRGLICTLYHIPAQSVSFATHDDAMTKAASWGLPVSEHRRICSDIAQIEDYISKWDKDRKSLPYATDGIVIKINELEAQRTLGSTAKSPRWAVAYKFKAQQAVTPILSIDYQVGRTGAVTPVANLSPVTLSGTVVKRATLVNEDQMRMLDIHLGDYVFVEKGGEIIPKITGVDLGRRPKNATLPEFPRYCPDCGAPLHKIEGEAKWFCTDQDNCPMQIKGRLLHFSSRNAMDILAGEATIEQLYNLGLVRTPADFYSLDPLKLHALEGWQEKSISRFLESIDKSREVEFERVLFALGIRFVGQTTAMDLARHFGSLDSVKAASIDDLLSVPSVGEVIANSVYEFFRDEKHIIEIERLSQANLKLSLSTPHQASSDALNGKTIVISGNFSISREEMKKLIESHGGKNSSSVSSKTSFLLAGTKPGPEKLAKCSELSIPVLSEEEFRLLLPIKEVADSPSSGQTFEELSLF